LGRTWFQPHVSDAGHSAQLGERIAARIAGPGKLCAHRAEVYGADALRRGCRAVVRQKTELSATSHAPSSHAAAGCACPSAHRFVGSGCMRVSGLDPEYLGWKGGDREATDEHYEQLLGGGRWLYQPWKDASLADVRKDYSHNTRRGTCQRN
jgi:hypothetical protein